MNRVECANCGEIVEVTGSSVVFPYVCSACLGDDTDYADEEGDDIPCDAPYNSGVPCQSALDSVQEEQYLDPYCVGKTDPRVHAMHSGDILDQFDADTELINGLMTENDDLKMKLSQANLNIQIQGEIIADLENTVGAYRVIFRIPGC